MTRAQRAWLPLVRRFLGNPAFLRNSRRDVLNPLCNTDHVHECFAELLPDRSKRIPDCRWRGCLRRSLDDSLAFQFAHAIRKHLCRDSGDVDLKLCKATLAFTEMPEHICRPGAPKQTHAFAERTCRRRWRNLAFTSLDHMEPLTNW